MLSPGRWTLLGESLPVGQILAAFPVWGVGRLLSLGGALGPWQRRAAVGGTKSWREFGSGLVWRLLTFILRLVGKYLLRNCNGGTEKSQSLVSCPALPLFCGQPSPVGRLGPQGIYPGDPAQLFLSPHPPPSPHQPSLKVESCWDLGFW